MRREKKKRVNLGLSMVGRVVGYGSLACIGLILTLMLFPMVGITVNAEGEPITSSAKMKAETYVYSTLAVSLSDKVSLDIVPKAGGSFASGGAELKVTTNNTTGYAVFLQTSDNTSTLKPANGMIQAEIKPVVGEMTATDYATNLNTWGYAVGEAQAEPQSLSYRAVPSSSDAAIITTDQLAAEDSYILGFAAAVGADLPAGSYYNSVLVSVVANPIAVHTLSGITYMQEMSPYVCDYSDEHETKQLIDTRDGKSYWVAKLKDGNCWMVQNLALDLEAGETLSSANTDVTKDWTIPENTGSIALGQKYIYAIPLYVQSCAASPGDDLVERCPASKFVNVTTDNWKSTYTAAPIAADSNGNYIFDGAVLNSSNNLVAVDYNEPGNPSAGGTYDAHYLAGNYYNFQTVTAGSDFGATTRNARASDSICPKNWQLPPMTAEESNNRPVNTDKSYYNLLLAYGYPTSDQYTQDGTLFVTPTTVNGEKTLFLSPIYLSFWGYAVTGADGIRIANSLRYWSNTSISTSLAISIDSYSASVYPLAGTSRDSYLQVRCVAK